MPWIIGIDEAGYGPNLGPLVQAAVAAHVPDETACLWKRLSKVVRRADDKDDGRVLIDDSKLVYSGPSGFQRLERGIFHVFADQAAVRQHLVRLACGDSLTDLECESWFEPEEAIPAAREFEEGVAPALADALEQSQVRFGVTRCVITPAGRFNDMIDRWQSKAAALEQGVITLLSNVLATIDDDEPVHIVIDKQGGRNFYAPWISAALPDGWVSVIREGALLSEYRVLGLSRPVHLRFEPRADSASLPVALASMLAKYLREVLMRQFNRYWIGHVPGLEPTAGYPGDARRFYNAIQPAMKKLGMKKCQVWRTR